MTVTDTPAIEDRLAALETALGLRAPMTDEQVEQFKATFDHCMGDGAFGHHQLRPLPPGPVITLTPDHVRQILRECVTVVKPGETLVIRANSEWTPHQVERLQEFLDGMAEWRDLGVKLLVLPGEEFAVVTQVSTGLD